MKTLTKENTGKRNTENMVDLNQSEEQDKKNEIFLIKHVGIFVKK